jgi:hypothetical protein
VSGEAEVVLLEIGPPDRFRLLRRHDGSSFNLGA